MDSQNQKQDFALNYLPKLNDFKFEKDLRSKGLLSLSNNKLHHELVNYTNKNMYWSSILYISAVALTSYYSSKIFLLKKIKSKYIRFGITALTCTTLITIYQSFSNKENVLKFDIEKQKIRDKYLKYRYTGDIRDLNPDIKIIKYFDE